MDDATYSLRMDRPWIPLPRSPRVDELPPVVYAAPPPPAIGTVVYALPPGCPSLVMNGIQYFSCGGGFYHPVYQGGGVAYQVVPPP
jgi:hypothetical protein